ncbi:MAG: (d)CMP kinase [Phycisphaerales bacterium]|nr:MAG: (d)CMP kinase [Phycisphaerales bacterium]
MAISSTIRTMPADCDHDHTPLIITIDGPAGTGKSTVAHGLAERLGLEYLDTGAMYRAAAVIALDQNLDPADGEALAEAVAGAEMRFHWAENPPPLMLGERDISDRIRDMDVSAIVSIVAAQPAVRRVLVQEQRRIASGHPRLVTEGRDQGSVVFPDAPLRFYLDADVSVRAERRMKQLAEAGKPVDRAHVMRDIRKRDRIDSTREDGPLTRPDGAIDIDTNHRTAEEVVDLMESIVRENLPDATGHPSRIRP